MAEKGEKETQNWEQSCSKLVCETDLDVAKGVQVYERLNKYPVPYKHSETNQKYTIQ